MKRRVFLGSVIASAAATKMPGLIPTPSSRIEATPTPPWLETQPLIAISSYAHPMFHRRMGSATTWVDEVYEKLQTEETVSKLKDLGATLVIIPCYCGFGLEAEKEFIADSRKLAALLRRYGMRVGVYVGSTIFYETFLLEVPEAKEWFVQDYLGKPVIYGSYTSRKRVYFMHPGYREYIKRVLRVAIEDLQVDMIHFDNTSMQAVPAIFQHPMAVEDFRRFLQNRYTAGGLKERLGLSDVRYVEPPRPDGPTERINDPLWQEWADFRCQQLARYYGEMKAFIRSLNPNVAVASNMGTNQPWSGGVDYPTLVPQTDIVWCEEANYAGISADGILVSKIRTYKMITGLNKRVLTYTTLSRAGDGMFQGDIPGGRVEMAESMVYNRQCLGNIGGGLAGYDKPLFGLPVSFEPTMEDRNYIQFFRRHFDLYRGVETVAEVAVLHTHASMGFNIDRPAVSFTLFAQTLIQAKVPFDIIFDDQLKNISKYRVLVLADQECLSNKQLALIREYVEHGGGVVATEHTSLYTEWRRRRPDFGLKDLLQVTAPAWPGVYDPEHVLEAEPVRHEFGKGRVTYLADVKPTIEKPPAVSMGSQYWKLPKNWQDLVDAVRWAAGGQLALEVDAPQTVTAELQRQPETGKLLLHLINYDLERTPRVRHIAVRLRLAKEPSEVLLFSPDMEGVQTLPHTVTKGMLAFVVPELKTYNVVAIS